jgi:hypothetical protein
MEVRSYFAPNITEDPVSNDRFRTARFKWPISALGRQRQFAARIPGNVGIWQLSTYSLSSYPIEKRTAYFLRL